MWFQCWFEAPWGREMFWLRWWVLSLSPGNLRRCECKPTTKDTSNPTLYFPYGSFLLTFTSPLTGLVGHHPGHPGGDPESCRCWVRNGGSTKCVTLSWPHRVALFWEASLSPEPFSFESFLFFLTYSCDEAFFWLFLVLLFLQSCLWSHPLCCLSGAVGSPQGPQGFNHCSPQPGERFFKVDRQKTANLTS